MKETGYRVYSWGSSVYNTPESKADTILDVRFTKSISNEDETNLMLEWHTDMHNGSKSYGISAGTNFNIPNKVSDAEILEALALSYGNFEKEVDSHRNEFSFSPTFISASKKKFNQNEVDLVNEMIDLYLKRIQKIANR